MTAKTVAERQRALREARRSEGMVRIDIWCRPEHAAAIRTYARELAHQPTARTARPR